MFLKILSLHPDAEVGISWLSARRKNRLKASKPLTFDLELLN
jgi:hypothetical protein